MERGEESCSGELREGSEKVKIEEHGRCAKKRGGQRGGRRGAKMSPGVRGCEGNSCVCSPWFSSLPACEFILKLDEIHFEAFIICFLKAGIGHSLEKEPAVFWDRDGSWQEFVNNTEK